VRRVESWIPHGVPRLEKGCGTLLYVMHNWIVNKKIRIPRLQILCLRRYFQICNLTALSESRSLDYRVINESGVFDGMKTDRGTRSTLEKIRPSAIFSITNLTYPNARLNPCRHDGLYMTHE
jgi:hypothetical protein